MASTKISSAHSSAVKWDSLKTRSIEASKLFAMDVQGVGMEHFIDLLQRCNHLDDFLGREGSSLMAWFFQRRDTFLSQERMTEWSRYLLDDYILLPVCPGFDMRNQCVFVSHFWRTQDHPDPDGECLRSFQVTLQPQHWSYIWIDWTCIPQIPRNEAEEVYFLRSLGTISGIIRSCGFIWSYPFFEARMWILYEIAEYTLTSSAALSVNIGIRDFLKHTQEMMQTSVRSVLDKYNYKCTYDRDEAFLTSWLEILVLLRKLSIEIVDIRKLMDLMTWMPGAEKLLYNPAPETVLQLCKFDGTLAYNEKCYTFTPFPRWVYASFF